MKGRILALVLLALVLGGAEPAAAIDDAFRGRYTAILRTIPGGQCPDSTYRRRAEVTCVGGRIREFDFVRSTRGTTRLRYLDGERLPVAVT